MVTDRVRVRPSCARSHPWGVCLQGGLGGTPLKYPALRCGHWGQPEDSWDRPEGIHGSMELQRDSLEVPRTEVRGIGGYRKIPGIGQSASMVRWHEQARRRRALRSIWNPVLGARRIGPGGQTGRGGTTRTHRWVPAWYRGNPRCLCRPRASRIPVRVHCDFMVLRRAHGVA